MSASFSSAQAVYRGEVFLFPRGFTIAGYRQVFSQAGLWLAYRNTLFYTFFGTLASIIATAIAAYPLSRTRFFARRFLNFFVVFTMYFSGGLIPFFILILNLGLHNTRMVMILPGLLSAFNVIVCRSAYAQIPSELEESAQIDGANDIQIFYRIAVRLITPTLAVLVLFYAVGQWNDFMTPLLFITSQDLIPMQVLLRRVLIQASGELIAGDVAFVEREAVSIQIRFVTIVVATLPILAVYPFIQRYFVKGVMLGAVKG